MVMRRIARTEGAPTDAHRDYDMTNWAVVNGLARGVAGMVRNAERARDGTAVRRVQCCAPRPHAFKTEEVATTHA